MVKKECAAVTPGEMLKEEFLTEYSLSHNQLTKEIGISAVNDSFIHETVR